MNFPFYIARRYLFSKKSHHTINIISGISMGGVAIATMALVCTLSVFNGFHDLVASLFTSFDAQIEISPAQGKTIAADSPALLKAKQHPSVAVYSESLEGQALVRYGESQAIVTIKGVSDNFDKCTDIEHILYGDGQFVLHADVLEYGVAGIGLASKLGTGSRYEGCIDVFAPRKGAKISMTDPSGGFNHNELYSSGIVFAVNQKKYDSNYLITSITFARNLFEQQGRISSVELRLKDNADVEKVKADLSESLGKDFLIKDRYEQQEDVFKIMKIEKLMAYLFLSFILMVACFNIIGSLSMLIVDKKDDVATLRHLGASDKQISRIFLFEGRLISTIGAIAGIILGLALCYAQIKFGLLRLGNSSGNFIVDAYPVSVHPLDILLILLTVIAVGYLSVWYPVRYLSKRLL